MQNKKYRYICPTREYGEEKRNSGSPVIRNFKRIFIFLVFFLLLALAGGAVTATVFVMKLSDELPDARQMSMSRINIPSIIYDRNNEVIAKLFTENRTLVGLENVAPVMIQAIIAAEDGEFYSHSGISWTGISRAVWVAIQQQIKGGGLTQGGSTITQQLARNLFLSSDKNIIRKIKEILLAFRLEKMYSKDKILEMYLNTIYFGNGAWGIDTAARTYFGKSASDLNLEESAMLAGIAPAPNRYNPITNLKSAKVRQAYVLDRMKIVGWLSDEEAETTKDKELVFKHMPNKVEEFNRAPYFVSQILFNELLPKYGMEQVYGGGLEIYTTIDIKLQEKAQEVVSKLKTQGALVSIVPETGEVITLVGGKDFKESKFNRATQAYRQPGSSFKPFIYAATIEEGLRPSDHFIDGRLTFKPAGGKGKGWSPGNYDGRYHGEVTMLYAITKSLNTVPVRAAVHIGVPNVVAFARKAGITTPYLTEDLSIALGSASVTPLEMAFAYVPFANGGLRPEHPLMIREIKSWTGEVIDKKEIKNIQVFSPETAWTILSMLTDAVNTGTGTRAKIPEVQVFGKTGTTNDWIDAWFIGGVPGLVTSVYVGKDDNTTLGKGITGGHAAAPSWQEFMKFAVETLSLDKKFREPSEEEGLSKIWICRSSGFKSVSGCPAVALYVKKGSGPTTSCPTHGGNGSMEDFLAPKLVKIAQDGGYSSRYGKQEEEEEVELPVAVAPRIIPLDIQVRKPLPVVPGSIEDRYDQLLKDYGLQ